MLECVTTSRQPMCRDSPSVKARSARAALKVGAHGMPSQAQLKARRCKSVSFSNFFWGQPWQALCVRVLDSAKQRWSRQKAGTSPQQCSQTATFQPQHCHIMTARVHEFAATPKK